MTFRTLTACLLLATPALALPQAPALEPLRWDAPYSYPDFIGCPWSVAVGDDGALAVVSRVGDFPGLDVHAGGSPEPIWMERYDDRVYIGRVAVADHAPVAAEFTLRDVDPDPNSILFEARMRLLEVGNGVVEAWSAPILTGPGWYWDAGGVALSDDGEVVVGWWDSTDQDIARMVAYRRDGTLISQFDLPIQVSGFNTGGVRLSDDGARAVLPGVDHVVLLDVFGGTVLASYETPTGTPLRGLAISGDGARFAVASWEEVVLFEEGAGGSFAKISTLPQVDDEHFGPLALDEDGGRLAYTIQHLSPANRYELVLLDVDDDQELWRVVQADPASLAPVHAKDVDIDAAGETVACASLGGPTFATPQVIVVDAAGQVVSEHHLGGSAMDVDLDPSGEVLVVAESPKYMAAYIGGRFFLADARPPTLRVLGQPQVGGVLDLTLVGDAAGGSGALWLASELGGSPTPFGTSALDLLGARRLGPWPLVGGVLKTPLALAGNPLLAGTLLHAQGVTFSAAGGRLTNKVSLRVMP